MFTFNLLFRKPWEKSCNTRIKNKCSRNTERGRAYWQLAGGAKKACGEKAMDTAHIPEGTLEQQ